MSDDQSDIQAPQGATYVWEDRTSIDPGILNEHITGTSPEDIARQEERMAAVLRDGRPIVDLPHYLKGEDAPLPVREEGTVESFVNSQPQAGGAIPNAPHVVDGEAQGVAGDDPDGDGPMPAKSATRVDWDEYAKSQGLSDDDVAGFSSKEDLQAHFGVK